LLEDGRRHYALMVSANRFSIDLGRFDRLISKLQDAPSVEDRHEARLAIHAAHAIRQGIMMRAFEIAGSLPSISARHGFEIGDVQGLILNMRIDEAVDRLARLFPIAGDQIDEFDDLKERRSDHHDFSPTDYAALHEELLTPLKTIQVLIRRISLSLCHAHLAYG
jgi:phosphoenolpyruvate carboxylase